MPKHRHRGGLMEGLVMPTKIRKRGCSSSSSSSSRIHRYRLNKRAIVVGKSRAGLGIGSRSITPVPTWRTTPLKSVIDSPKHSQSGKSTQPVSARRLAATLWEMNEVPSPKVSEGDLEVMKLKQNQKKSGSKMVFKREKSQSGWGLQSSSGSLPPHLSEPSHSPTVSEKMEQSGLSSRLRTPSVSQKLRSAEQNAAVFSSISNASLMDVETRSRPPTSSGSVSGNRNRLKEVSSALTTSKELLKIINRIWAQAHQPSSSMSIISALHAELERARLQVNQLIQEQRSDKNEVHHLMKCFSEEKKSWKNKEHLAIEAAIASVASELEVERKLRRRLESLNKKLGKELAEMKSSFVKAVEELESEKRAREITEQMCDELARNIDEDRAGVEKLKSESVKAYEEAEKEREMLELADKLHEERAQMKLCEAKHQFEEKNSAISKLRKQLEAFLGAKREKDEERESCLSKSNIVTDQRDNREDSVGSNHHSIESNMNNASSKSYKKSLIDEIKGRNSVSDRRSTNLQRAVSDGVEWGGHGTSHYSTGDGLEREAHRSSYHEDRHRYKPGKDHVLSSPRLSCYSSSLQREQSWPTLGTVKEGHGTSRATSSKSRMGDGRGEGLSSRRSKW